VISIKKAIRDAERRERKQEKKEINAWAKNIQRNLKRGDKALWRRLLNGITRNKRINH
jgi:hypothetical protein